MSLDVGRLRGGAGRGAGHLHQALEVSATIPDHLGVGPSEFVELGFSLPRHPELWVRIALTLDQLFNDALQPGKWDDGMLSNARLGLAFAYFF